LQFTAREAAGRTLDFQIETITHALQARIEAHVRQHVVQTSIGAVRRRPQEALAYRALPGADALADIGALAHELPVSIEVRGTSIEVRGKKGRRRHPRQ